MRLNAIALLASVMALFVTNAQAQTQPDFVFTVPVRIENAPPFAGHQASVYCSVQSTSVGRIIRAGDGRTNIDIGPTGYRGSVRVEVRLREGIARADTQAWNCSLEFFNVTNRAGANVGWGAPNSQAALPSYPIITGQNVASANFDVQGDTRR